MRGTPFLKEGFHGGLNTIDSPYTLAETESRELLNVVSTERGSILKRNGSVLFTSETPIPTEAIKDALTREENPLSNGGKWETITGAANTGKDGLNGWEATAVGKEAGALWNVEEQINPCVAMQSGGFGFGPSASFGVWACLSKTAKSGYLARWRFEEPTKAGQEEYYFQVTLEKWVAGIQTVLKTVSKVRLGEGPGIRNYAISVRGGKIRAWAKRGATTWTELAYATDGTYTKGYCGIMQLGEMLLRFGNFSFAELGAGANIPAKEFQTLAPVTVSGTNYLIGATETSLYSITTSGEATKIGTCTNGRWSVVVAPKTTGVAEEGPVYLVNGVDKPKYWTGVEKATALVEWKGIKETKAKEFKDGKLNQASVTLSSATAEFFAGDVGVTVVLESKEPKVLGVVVKQARIVTVISKTEVKLEIAEAGWEAEYASVEFQVERSYYGTSPNVPNGQYMVFAGNRIWMTGIKADPSAVWFSEAVSIGEGGEQADPSAWPKSNVVRFDGSDGYPITGIGTVGPYVLIFKEFKTWAIHDLNTGVNRKIADKIGCVASRSIVETQNGTYFLTADQGVYLTEGSKLHEMSYNVRPTLLKINATERANAAGEYYNNHYYLSFPYETSLVNNRTLDYDTILKSWWLHDLAGNQWCKFSATTGESNLFTIPAKASGGVVRAFVPNVFTDSGENYTGNGVLGAFWISPWEPFAYYIFRHRIKAPFLKKRVRQIFFDGEGSIIPFVFKNFSLASAQEPAVVGNTPESQPSFPTNFSIGKELWANENEAQLWAGETFEGLQMLWGGQAQASAARIYAPGIARVWSVGFGNNSPEPFTVNAFAYMVSFRKS